MNNISDKLKSVLCNPEGKVCIKGSDGDRKTIQECLNKLEIYEQQKTKLQAEVKELGTMNVILLCTNVKLVTEKEK